MRLAFTFEEKKTMCDFLNVRALPLVVSVLALLAGCTDVVALQDAVAEDNKGSAETYGEIIKTDKPIAYWSFDERADDQFANRIDSAELSARVLDKVLQVDGPRTNHYPLFDNDNRAALFSGAGHLIVSDPGEKSSLDFDLKDTITIEAWVRPEKIENGQYVYVVGKGRTHNKGVAADNQNYALRLAGVSGTARVSFLFRNKRNEAGDANDFHRWISSEGFWLDDRWHHIAVSYTFGKPDSIRGYLDGKKVSGKWDAGGATKDGPVVDDDEIWIGGSKGGKNGNSFHGGIDEVAIYRSALSADRIAARYRAEFPSAHQRFTSDDKLPKDSIHCEVIERVRLDNPWNDNGHLLTTEFQSNRFALTGLPNKYNDWAVIDSRSKPLILRMRAKTNFEAGKYRLLVRARSKSRLFIDGEQVAELAMMAGSGDAHQDVPELVEPLFENMHPLPGGCQEKLVEVDLESGEHLIHFETLVGSKTARLELGEMFVAIGSIESEELSVLSVGAESSMPLTESVWREFEEAEVIRIRDLNTSLRQTADSRTDYWKERHEFARETTNQIELPKKPKADFELVELSPVDRFINVKLAENDVRPNELIDDYAFLKRLALDTVGVIPSREEFDVFFADESTQRRANAVDRFVNDDRWADHGTAYWQDVLAENPGILKPKLNNTGPFRYWIYESLLDNKPMDRFATELVMLGGGKLSGGPAGFGMATQNDAPMAAKAHTLTKAFLAMEMKCARCHDSPSNDFKQEDLFSVAAMMNRAAIKLPETSTVPIAKGARIPAIEISLKPGEVIKPEWPFKDYVDLPKHLLQNPGDSRARLADLMTSPTNDRFAKVIVNRLWQRLFGRGFVNPVDDWSSDLSEHAQLHQYLATELMQNNYDLKHVARLILNSAAYQREVIGAGEENAKSRIDLFAGQSRRRLSAEQMVDSLFAAVGKPIDAEPLTLDPQGRLGESTFLNLGVPRRAWQFVSLSNERDRPALALPVAQSIYDLLKSYGWRDSRPSPITDREEVTTVLQPLTVGNGVAGHRLVQLSDKSAITRICLEAENLNQLIDRLYLQVLSREPETLEREIMTEFLQEGFETRVKQPSAEIKPPPIARRNAVSWSNHLSKRATEIKMELEELARAGDPPTDRLDSEWRERAEDALWAILNSPEFVFVP